MWEAGCSAWILAQSWNSLELCAPQNLPEGSFIEGVEGTSEQTLSAASLSVYKAQCLFLHQELAKQAACLQNTSSNMIPPALSPTGRTRTDKMGLFRCLDLPAWESCTGTASNPPLNFTLQIWSKPLCFVFSLSLWCPTSPVQVEAGPSWQREATEREQTNPRVRRSFNYAHFVMHKRKPQVRKE